MNRVTCTCIAAAGLALATLPSPAASTWAATPERGTVIDRGTLENEDHFLVEDSCDVPGLTTQVDIVWHGTYVIRARGRERLPYDSVRWRGDYVFTNVDNGKYVTIHSDIWEKDIWVRNNHDGTSTGLNTGRRHAVMRNQHGRKLAYESVRTLARWKKDNNHTPRKPGDDEFINWKVLREAGHVADYCAATVAAVSDPKQAAGPRIDSRWPVGDLPSDRSVPVGS